jgi:diguanylate cyclase (GGDEF)-like protein
VDASAAQPTILVVDDDDATRTLVSRWLAKEGFTVLGASSGDAALKLVFSSQVDCIVLDVMMPGMSGVEVLRQIRAQNEALPVLMLTAHATGDEDVVAAMEAGASDYIFKPFSGPVMVARVRALAMRGMHARQLQNRLQEAEKSATVDALTGLYNRRHLDRSLIEEAARARRQQNSCSIVLCDLDHFKRLNDTHGHQEGDRALKYFGAKLLSILRGEDRAFRYGGEEFLLLLPGAEAEGARRVAERLREALVRDPHTRDDGAVLAITFSAGVAALNAKTDFSFQGVLEQADKALYAAKQAGRNCTLLALAQQDPNSVR